MRLFKKKKYNTKTVCRFFLLTINLQSNKLFFMKIVILDGHALNPGDLSYDVLNEFGEVVYYPRTSSELTLERIGEEMCQRN